MIHLDVHDVLPNVSIDYQRYWQSEDDVLTQR